MFTLCVKARFSGAHRLVNYPGACQRIHGHNWQVKARIRARELDEQGMVMDLMQLSSLLKECLDQYDHRMVNEVAPFDSLNPTSENLARTPASRRGNGFRTDR